MIRRSITLAIILSLFCGQAYSVPDQTMDISPAASSGTTISSTDENNRNNDISTSFNSHSHTDITAMSGVNTFTIGDNAAGNKTYAVDTDQSNSPGIRYNTSTDMWTLSQDGASYLAVAHASTTDGLTSGAMLYATAGTVSAGIVSVGPATDGQVLIGRTGAVPTLASVSWQWIETLDTSSGTSVGSLTLPTDSELFMVVFENVRGTAGDNLAFKPNGNTTADKDYVAMTNATLAETTGATSFIIGGFSTGSAVPVNGVLYIPRLAQNSDLLFGGSVMSISSANAENQYTFISGHWDGGASNLTSMEFDGTTFTGGKIHIYKSVPS